MSGNTTLADGRPVPADNSHTTLKSNGQQQDYIVLSATERARGFIKPVRQNYKHVGPALPTNLRDLTDSERTAYTAKWGYVKYQTYPADADDSRLGKFWTQAEIDRATKGCGAVTNMSLAIAETYARDPAFYSGTFCIICARHFPLNEFTWLPDGEPMDPALQAAWRNNALLNKVQSHDVTLAVNEKGVMTAAENLDELDKILEVVNSKADATSTDLHRSDQYRVQALEVRVTALEAALKGKAP